MFLWFWITKSEASHSILLIVIRNEDPSKTYISELIYIIFWFWFDPITRSERYADSAKYTLATAVTLFIRMDWLWTSVRKCLYRMWIGHIWLSKMRLLMHPDLNIPGTSTKIFIKAHSELVYYWIKRAWWSWLFLDFI